MLRSFLTAGLMLASLTALAALVGGGAGAPKLSLSTAQVLQGDCFFAYLVGVDAQPTITWAGRQIPLFMGPRGWQAVLPVAAAAAPGRQKVWAAWTDPAGDTQRLAAPVTVKTRKFPAQYLRLSAQQESLYEYPGVEEEYRQIRAALGRFSPAAYWRGKFLRPVTGRRNTAFGTQRFRNGKKQGIHKGLDYGAPLGAAVHAANAGVVALTAEDFRLHGKTVIVDHGRGVCTLYLHLSKILVQPGQQVEQGQIIARVGATGVATGPHLHYGLYVADTAVDPAWWEQTAR